MPAICWLGLIVLGILVVLAVMVILISSLFQKFDVLKENNLYLNGRVSRQNIRIVQQMGDLNVMSQRLHRVEEEYWVPTVTLFDGRLQKSTEDAACWDVYSREEVIIPAGSSKVVKTGLFTEMDGCDAFLFDRSGLAAKNRVTRRAGVIDEKYPEEWGVILVNEGLEPFIVRVGDRIAQAFFMPKFEIEVGISKSEGKNPQVVILDQERKGGFGSTGS